MNREYELVNEIFNYIMQHNLKTDEKFYKWITELREIMENRIKYAISISNNQSISGILKEQQRSQDDNQAQKNIKNEEEIKILSGMVTAYRDVIRILKDKE